MARTGIDVEQRIDKVVQALLLGATYELAAMYAGISHDTLLRWRKKAVKAAAPSPFARLRERMEEAEGRAAIGWLAKIEKAATEGNWNAAAWKLERRYPETYGRTVQHVENTVTVTIKLQESLNAGLRRVEELRSAPRLLTANGD